MIPLKVENAGLKFPLITVMLIAANIGVFIYVLWLPLIAQHDFILSYGMIPAQLLGQMKRPPDSIPAGLTLLSSQFMHAGIFHLLGNMLYLWIFGNNLENLLGKIRFLLFYLLCGVLAAVGHLVLYPFSTVPMVGASGAIAGVLGAYLVSFPGTRVLVLTFIFFFVTTLRISAFWVLAFWFLMQLFYATGSLGSQGTNVAYMAHVAGFVAGIWLVRKFRPGLKWRKMVR